ncbi:MAG: hypothetical protein H0V34_03355 [Gammaproteobacteria bacterium]|nr:hypothetical protein [Gammaproteobacteria bacterium]
MAEEDSQEKQDEKLFEETLMRMLKTPPKPHKKKVKAPKTTITCHPDFRMLERTSVPDELQSGIVGAGDIYIDVFSAASDDNITARRNAASDDCTPPRYGQQLKSCSQFDSEDVIVPPVASADVTSVDTCIFSQSHACSLVGR